MSEKDKANLLAILDSCAKIKLFTRDTAGPDDFYEDERTFDAVLMNFVVIGEAVARLSEELKEKEKEVPWSQIKGLRNIVAHDYFGVDAEEVWQIVQNNLPVLTDDISKIIKGE